jgi:hypothetical protein
MGNLRKIKKEFSFAQKVFILMDLRWCGMNLKRGFKNHILKIP